MEVNSSNVQEIITNQVQVKAKAKDIASPEKESSKVSINEEVKKSFKETYEGTINKKESTTEDDKEPDELQTEISAIMNTLNIMVDIPQIKAQLSTGDKETVNKITFEIQKILSKITDYSSLPSDEKSKVFAKVLEEIKGEFVHEVPRKFTFSKINFAMNNKSKSVSISDKVVPVEVPMEVQAGDDSLINAIKTEINDKINVGDEVIKDIKTEVQNTNVKDIVVSDVKKQISSKTKEEISVAPEFKNTVKAELVKTDINAVSLPSKEEKLLKDLISPMDKISSSEVGISNNNDIDSKIQKVTMFSSILNNIKNDNILVPEKDMFISKDNMVKDIIKTVKYMEINNVKNMTVKIMPKELGEVVIKITMESGVMKANLVVNNKEAYNIINSNLSDINGKLSNQDIKIQNFTIDIYKDSTFFSNESGRDSSEHQKNNNSNNGTNALEDDTNINNEEDLLGRINILA